jgi:hypothetical protein
MENYDTIMYFIDNWLLEGSFRNAEVLSSKTHGSMTVAMFTLVPWAMQQQLMPLLFVLVPTKEPRQE